MTRFRKLFWFLLFFFCLSLLLTLATSWNWIILEETLNSWAESQKNPLKLPWPKLTFGSFGFGVIFFGIILFYVQIVRLFKINQYQSDFLMRISHELKTPLSTLELSSELLQKKNLNEEDQKKLWHAHQTELMRLKGDIEMLISSSNEKFTKNHWSEKSLKSAKTVLYIEDYLQKRFKTWSQLLGSEDQISRSGEPLHDVCILGQEQVLDLIFENILGNSKKFSGVNPVQVHIRTCKTTGWFGKSKFSILIQDQGIGFPSHERKKLFQRFYRHSSVAQKIPGNGLGLHLAQSAARILKLNLSAWSEGPQQGATFILSGDIVKNASQKLTSH